MLLADKLLTLKSTELFCKLEANELLTVAGVAKYQSYSKGDIIFREDNSPAKLVIVAYGTVSATKDGVSVKTIKAPLIIGAENILLEQHSKYSWQAESDNTEILAIQKSHFFTIIHQCPQILEAFFNSTPDFRDLIPMEAA